MGPWVGNSGRGAIRRFGFWAVVLGIHGALILLFSFDTAEERAEADSEPRRAMTVVFLDMPLTETPPDEPQPAADAPPAAPVDPRRAALENPSTVAAPADTRDLTSSELSPSVDSPDGTALTLPSGSPSVDWDHERAITAQAMVPELLKQNQTKCEAERRPGSMLPKCRQPAKDPPWEPEPGRFGISGLIPFMRLGKRCAIGLGFFGCALGKLPEANSHLLDEMRNPDREHSSVPEVDRSSALDP